VIGAGAPFPHPASSALRSTLRLTSPRPFVMLERNRLATRRRLP